MSSEGSSKAGLLVTTSKMEGRRIGKLHCWECRRRYLVCDSTEPECKRCSISGVQCPGYNEVKPARLKWLAPGRVVSRNRRRKVAPSNEVKKNYGKVTARAGTDLVSNTRNGFVAIPRFEMKMHSCVLPEAAEYCMRPSSKTSQR